MAPGLLVPLALLVATISIAVCAPICPSITRARRHYRLEVVKTPFLLPDGSRFSAGVTYNGSYIGPTITATLGEELSVDVFNKGPVGTTVHWHGLDLREAAWADGVDGFAQRPIPPGSTFRYKFKAEPAGTYWYHAHTGMQFPDGLRGPLIVQDPNDPFKGQYDEEVILLLTDQNDISGEEELAKLQKGDAGMMMGMCKNVSDQDWSDAPYTTILTNGKGWMMDMASKKPVGEAAVIKVQKGKRYRLRFIQGAGSWGIKVTLNKHTCRVIALDGINIMPKDVKGFTLTAGERLDCILNANQRVGNYYINIATLVGNNSPAVLSYVGAPDPKLMPPPVLDLGCQYALPQMDVLDFKNETDLAAFDGVPRPPPAASKQLVVYLSNSADPEGTITKVLGPNPTIPGLTGVKPQQGCKLANGQESMYCWTLNWVPFGDAIGKVPLLFPDAKRSPTTYMVDVPLNSVVDIALINPGAMVHPMHMHGTHFWVLGTGNGDILTMDGKINYTKLNIDNPVYRDTQPVANAVPASRLGMGPMDPMRPMQESDTLSTASADTSVPADSTPAPTEVMPGMAGSDVLPASSDMPGMGGEKLVYGYAVIRFKASNAGVWPFHCHIDLHANTGMLMGFQVPRRVGLRKPWALPKGVTQCAKE